MLQNTTQTKPKKKDIIFIIVRLCSEQKCDETFYICRMCNIFNHPLESIIIWLEEISGFISPEKKQENMHIQKKQKNNFIWNTKKNDISIEIYNLRKNNK